MSSYLCSGTLAWSAVIGLLTLTIIALGAAYWARKEKNRADAQAVIATQQRNTAVARELIAQSQLKLREEYDTALLLSIQAYRGFPTMETLTHLHYVLDSRREVGRIFHGHKGKVIFVSITPDGSKVVSGDDRGTMIMRQLQGEQSPISLQTVDRVEVMALHPSKEMVALAVDDEIVLWDLAKRQPIGEVLKGHRGAVTSLAFDPEGKLLASGSWDNTAMLWDVASRSALHKPLRGHLDNSDPLEMAVGVNAVAFSPDGTLLATTGNDNRVLLWNVATGERYGKPLEGHKTRPGQLFPGVQAVAFDPSGTLLATGGRDHEIFLWDVKTQSPVGDPLQADSGVTALAFSGNERVLFSATEFGRIQAWNIADHSPIAEPLQGYPGKITCLAVDPSAPGLISGGENGKLIVWRPFRFSDRLARLLTHPEPNAVPVLNPNTGRRHFPDLLRRVTFSDGGELAASASDDGVVVVWDAKSGREIDRFTTHPAGVFALKFDPSAKRIAVAGYGDMVVVREIGSGRWKGLRGHGRAVGALAFSADGSMLAAGTASGSCKIWKLDPPELLGEWKLHERPVALVAFREKDDELISVDLDGKVKLWEVASRKLVRADDGGGESEGTCAISGNGNVLANCIHGGIALWDVAKWTPLGVGTIPVGESNQYGKGLALSADGSVVAFGQGTGITLYSTRSGERLLPALAVRASLDDVAVSPDGKTLAAVGGEPDVYLWNLDVESWVARAFEVAGRILTEDEWQHYCPGQPYHPTP
jgi:WD40 repeat protein